jgi:DedD protein
MDQQLKERLVGAAVLVALTAIFVPMVLDGPAPPTASVPPTLAPAPVDASTFGYDLTAPLPGAPASAAAPATIAAAPAAVSKPDTAKPAGPKPAMPQATAPTAQASAAPKPKEPTTAAKPSSSSSSGGAWAAQVGSFSKEATAKAIADDLKRRGFKAFVMEHRDGGKSLYRVRVGPVATREAADALGGKITQQTGQAARPVRHP